MVVGVIGGAGGVGRVGSLVRSGVSGTNQNAGFVRWRCECEWWWLLVSSEGLEVAEGAEALRGREAVEPIRMRDLFFRGANAKCLVVGRRIGLIDCCHGCCHREVLTEILFDGLLFARLF